MYQGARGLQFIITHRGAGYDSSQPGKIGTPPSTKEDLAQTRRLDERNLARSFQIQEDTMTDDKAQRRKAIVAKR